MCDTYEYEHLGLPESTDERIERLLGEEPEAQEPEPEHHIGGWVARAQAKTVPTHDGTGGGHFAFVR